MGVFEYISKQFQKFIEWVKELGVKHLRDCLMRDKAFPIAFV